MKLYKFYGSFCAPCKVLSPIVDSVMLSFPKIKLISIDVEKEKNMVKKFNIFFVPKLILIDEKDNILWEHNGLINKIELIKSLNYFYAKY